MARISTQSDANFRATLSARPWSHLQAQVKMQIATGYAMVERMTD